MKKLTEDEVIQTIKKISNYDTSLVKYENSNKKICLICHCKDNNNEEHGAFYITLGHLKHGHGCPICGLNNRVTKRRSTKQDFIKKAKKIHGDKYDYSKVEYVNCHTKVCIICPEHGEFWQTPASHLTGRNCPKCSNPCYKYTIEDFIKKAKQVHGDKYDYSKVEYINSQTKVCIICPKHGEFWQAPGEHLYGYGCKHCKESHLESEIRFLLTKNNIKFKYDVRNISWLKPLTYDFYLPDYNIAIECQGEQHFMPVKYFGGENAFNKRKELDALKYKLSINNNVKILYYSHNKYNDNIITDTDMLLDIIKTHLIRDN